jgi:hypothetical protein
MKGGRVSMQQVATDAFGNALGDAIVASQQPDPIAGTGSLRAKGDRSDWWNKTVQLDDGSASTDYGLAGDARRGAFGRGYAVDPNIDSSAAGQVTLVDGTTISEQENMSRVQAFLAMRPTAALDGNMTGQRSDAGHGGDGPESPVNYLQGSKGYLDGLKAAGLPPVNDGSAPQYGTTAGEPRNPLDDAYDTYMRYGGRAGSGLLNAASGANIQTSPPSAWPRLLTSDERSIVFEHGGAISSTTERAVISDPMGSGAAEILAAGGSAGLAESRSTSSTAVANPSSSAALASRLDGVPSDKAGRALTSMATDRLTYDMMTCDRSVTEFYKRMDLPYSPSPTGGRDVNGVKMGFLEYQDYLAAQGKDYHRVLSPDETRQTGDLGWAKPGALLHNPAAPEFPPTPDGVRPRPASPGCPGG